MNIIQSEIIKKINEFTTIIIHRHVHPDPDALGSQCGLQNIIKASFPDKKVFVVGEEVESLLFMNRMEQITDDVYQNALVFACDTANLERISDERYKLGGFLIKIDHHPERETYGDLSWVDTSYSSTCEMIMDLFLNFKDELVLNQDAARLLFTGIIGDTGRFMYNNTTAKTLRLAATLLEYNVDFDSIYRTLYKTAQNEARLKGHILENFKVTSKGVAYFYCAKDVMDKFGVNSDLASNQVNVLSNIEGNQIWVLFIEHPDAIRVRIRSAKTPIKAVAEMFKGGGHPLASGATVSDWNEAKKLIETLNNVL